MNYTGRMNRAKYFGYGLLAGVITSIAATALGWIVGYNFLSAVLIGLIYVAYAVVFSMFVVKRLHDLGLPGWHFWLLLIPLYNIYLSLVLLFKKGTVGPNAYGEDPLVQ